MNQEISYAEVINQLVRDRFNKTFRELEDKANDPSMVAMARVKARHLAAEIP